jgi:hypothetical protein
VDHNKALKCTKRNKIRKKSSLELTLKHIKDKFPVLKRKLSFMPKTFKEISLKPIEMSLIQQIKLLVLDL